MKAVSTIAGKGESYLTEQDRALEPLLAEAVCHARNPPPPWSSSESSAASYSRVAEKVQPQFAHAPGSMIDPLHNDQR